MKQLIDRIRSGGRALVMGVLNVTPDSFSDGGRFFDSADALEHASRLAKAGADIIDVGGESTRPGSAEVSVQDELKRVIPVVEAIVRKIDVPVSVDTSKPEVMTAACDAGAALINDVWALRRPGALEAAVECGVPVCLMHMQGEPGTMQRAPVYGDVVKDVMDFLAQRVDACIRAGIDRDNLIVDPGFGFGKKLEHNLALLTGLGRFTELGLPILVGLSRKSMIGAILDKSVDQREAGSLALSTIAAWQGARILRVHDVAETIDAARIVEAAREIEARGEHV